MDIVLELLIGYVLMVIVGLIGLAVYYFTAKFLNDFNIFVYGKTTIMAWVPISNVYLLGKLAVNEIVGWILVAFSFVASISVDVSKDGVYQFDIPRQENFIVVIIYYVILIGLYIYAYVKYSKLKKNNPEGFISPKPIENINDQINTNNTPLTVNPETEANILKREKQVKIYLIVFVISFILTIAFGMTFVLSVPFFIITLFSIVAARNEAPDNKLVKTLFIVFIIFIVILTVLIVAFAIWCGIGMVGCINNGCPS